MYYHSHPEALWAVNFWWPSATLSEWQMTYPCHIPAISVSNLWHVDLSSSFRTWQPNFLTCSHPAPSPQFPWPIISNVMNLDHVHQCCAESYAVGCMNECSMMIVMQRDLYWALNSPSMAHMISLTYILLRNFITTIVLAFSHNSNRQTDIEYSGLHTSRFGF